MTHVLALLFVVLVSVSCTTDYQPPGAGLDQMVPQHLRK